MVYYCPQPPSLGLRDIHCSSGPRNVVVARGSRQQTSAVLRSVLRSMLDMSRIREAALCARIRAYTFLSRYQSLSAMSNRQGDETEVRPQRSQRCGMALPPPCLGFGCSRDSRHLHRVMPRRSRHFGFVP